MSKTEQELLLRMSLLSLRLNDYDVAFQSGDLDKTKEAMNQFTASKKGIEEILNKNNTQYC